MNHVKKMRTRKLIDKSLQLRLVGAFVAVGCVATLFQVVLLNQSMLSLSKDLAQNGDILLSQTPAILVRSVLITLGLLVPCMTLVGILVTHRIAGPAYRMRMYLKEVEETGVVPNPCRIRKHDELQDMCVLLNQALEVVAEGDSSSTQMETANPVASESTLNALEAAPSLTGAAAEAEARQSANPAR